ncbi:hypothetical protein PBY51_011935 [Eleginops maclovinus]|uniref:Uncharacterized protein n=1 Tax=Eleginops maclovinus TaxID=56733 RepID=A0AAN8AUC2_ELEMC|nr:hypothetical protein PBY51_011935 [Eleginops maclovinus]
MYQRSDGKTDEAITPHSRTLRSPVPHRCVLSIMPRVCHMPLLSSAQCHGVPQGPRRSSLSSASVEPLTGALWITRLENLQQQYDPKNLLLIKL